MTTQHFELKNISCSSCVMHLEGLEDDVAGIERIDVNFKKQTTKVDYDPSQLGPEQIVLAVTALGYVAIPVELTETKGSRWNRLFRS